MEHVAPNPLNGDILARDLSAAEGKTIRVVFRQLDGVVELEGVDSLTPTGEQVMTDHPAKAQAALDDRATERTNEVSLRDKSAQALTDNKTFLAIASPTNAQVVAQVKALTRQNNGLIRLVLRRLEATD